MGRSSPKNRKANSFSLRKIAWVKEAIGDIPKSMNQIKDIINAEKYHGVSSHELINILGSSTEFVLTGASPGDYITSPTTKAMVYGIRGVHEEIPHPVCEKCREGMKSFLKLQLCRSCRKSAKNISRP